MTRLRSGGDDHVFRLDLLDAGIATRLKRIAGIVLAGESTLPLDPGDLVLAEQELDPLGVLGDDRILAREHFRDIDRDAGDRDAVLTKRVPQLLVVLGGFEQRLGRYAADIQTGAAERRLALGILPFFDTRNREAELSGAHRGDIACGPGADHHHIESLHDLNHSVRPRRVSTRGIKAQAGCATDLPSPLSLPPAPAPLRDHR